MIFNEHTESNVYNRLAERRNKGEELDIDKLTYEELYDMVASHITNNMMAELFNVKSSVVSKIKSKLNCNWYQVTEDKFKEKAQQYINIYGVRKFLESQGLKMNDEVVPEQNTILFHITDDQVDLLARHFGYDAEDISKMEEYEICEMLDKYIDELE